MQVADIKLALYIAKAIIADSDGGNDALIFEGVMRSPMYRDFGSTLSEGELRDLAIALADFGRAVRQSERT